MTTTIIGFIVENEIAFAIPINSDEPDAESRKLKFLSNPDVVEITHLPYTPVKGSTWDGSNFIVPEGFGGSHGQSFQTRSGLGQSRTFAFILNGVCTGIMNLMSQSDAAIAALLSNPTFLDITEMVNSLRPGVSYLGKFIRNGQIVSE